MFCGWRRSNSATLHSLAPRSHRYVCPPDRLHCCRRLPRAGRSVCRRSKPDASIKSRNVDASVVLDDKIKANATLSADCLAEGRKWIDKNAAEADASRKQDPVLFRNGGWGFERTYTVSSEVDGRYISIVRSDYVNTGGAHPNSDVDTILWDDAAKKRIGIRPFFTETADNGPTMKAMLKDVIASLSIEKKKRDTTETVIAEWYKGLEPKLLKIGAVKLTPSTEGDKSSGLTFHYPPYAVGPYAEGHVWLPRKTRSDGRAVKTALLDP